MSASHYLQDRAACEIAEREAAALVQAVSLLTSDWKRLRVINGGVGTVRGSMSFSAPLLALSQWPSAEKVGQVLFAWHNAYDRMVAAWNALAPEDRLTLPPPLVD